MNILESGGNIQEIQMNFSSFSKLIKTLSQFFISYQETQKLYNQSMKQALKPIKEEIGNCGNIDNTVLLIKSFITSFEDSLLGISNMIENFEEFIIDPLSILSEKYSSFGTNIIKELTPLFHEYTKLVKSVTKSKELYDSNLSTYAELELSQKVDES